MVAKSYEGLPQNGDPFEENGKWYVYITTKKGLEKKVRWYSIPEYKKLYPNEVVEDPYARPLKEVLGFKEGYVYLLKGDRAEFEKFSKTGAMRYNTVIGWFVCLDDNSAVPEIFQKIRLNWPAIATDDNTLRDPACIRDVVIQLVGADNYKY